MLRHFCPDRKRSQITTRAPAADRSATMFDPMKPAPPVTTISSSSVGKCWFANILGCRVLNHDAGDHGPRQGIQQGEEFLQFVQPSVGDVNDVLVFDGKTLGKEIGIGVTEIEAVDRGGTATELKLTSAFWPVAPNTEKVCGIRTSVKTAMHRCFRQDWKPEFPSGLSL